jgi:hypothetical protein
MPVHLKRRAAEQEQLRHMRQSAAEGKGKRERVSTVNRWRIACSAAMDRDLPVVHIPKLRSEGGRFFGSGVAWMMVVSEWYNSEWWYTSPYQTRPDQTRPDQCCSMVVLRIGCIGCMGCMGCMGWTDRRITVRPMSEKSRGPGRSREEKLNFQASPDLGIWCGFAGQGGMRLVCGSIHQASVAEGEEFFGGETFPSPGKRWPYNSRGAVCAV